MSKQRAATKRNTLTAAQAAQPALNALQRGTFIEEYGTAILNEVLRTRESFIIVKRYCSETPLTLQACADQLAVSRQRVFQLEERAVQKLDLAIEHSEFIGLSRRALNCLSRFGYTTRGQVLAGLKSGELFWRERGTRFEDDPRTVGLGVDTFTEIVQYLKAKKKQ